MRKPLFPLLFLLLLALPSVAQQARLFIPRLDFHEETLAEASYSPDGQWMAQLTNSEKHLNRSAHPEIWIWRTHPLRPIHRITAPEELQSELLEIPDFSGRYWFSADSKTLFAECARGILKVLLDEGQLITIPSNQGLFFHKLKEQYLSEDGRFYLKIGTGGGMIMNAFYSPYFCLELFDLAEEYGVLELSGPMPDESQKSILEWLFKPDNLGISQEQDALYYHFPFDFELHPNTKAKARAASLSFDFIKETRKPRKLADRFTIWRELPGACEAPYDLSITRQGVHASTPDGAAAIRFELTKPEEKASERFDCYCQEISSLATVGDGEKLLFSLKPCSGNSNNPVGPQPKIMLLDLKQNRLRTAIDGIFFPDKITAGPENTYFSDYNQLFKASTRTLIKTPTPLSAKALQPAAAGELENPALMPAVKVWPSYVSMDAPDGSFQLHFSHGYASHVALSGPQAETKTKLHKGEVWQEQVSISPDNRFVFLAVEGRIDIWDTQNHTLTAKLIFLDAESWVAITPSGLFDASPRAMSKLYYVVGREAVELEQLKERYYEPGLSPKLLGFSDEPIRSVSDLEDVPLYPEVDAEIRKDTLYIQLKARSGGIGKVSLFINSKEVLEQANPGKRPSGNRDSSIRISLEDYRRYFYAHPDSINHLTVRAYNEAGWLKSSPLTLPYKPIARRAKGEGGASGFIPSFEAVKDPALYAIIIGTADYAGDKLDLKYSGKDAITMANAILQSGSQLFGVNSTFIHLFTTDTTDLTMHPTKGQIEAAFRAFEKAAKAEDILLVYLSGHGITYGDADRAQFYYLTQEIASADLSDDGIRRSRTISSSELARWINLIPAQKQVLILDACYSGGLIESLSSTKKSLTSTQVRAFDRMQDRTGMFVIAGSASNKVSYEAGKYGQGLLTYSLLQGIDGLALREGKYIDVARLFEFAQQRVPELAEDIGGIQQPMADGPLRGSFDVGIRNEKVAIDLSTPKPVFVRNHFQDEALFDDVLGIGELLEEYFQQLSAMGVNAPLIYVDVHEYTKAYSLKGRYQRTDNEVRVYGKLFKGKEDIKDFDVTASQDALQGLPAAILKQIQDAVE